MQINIKHSKEAINVTFGQEKIQISQNSNQWNNENINSFLLKLASATPNGVKIEINTSEPNKESEISEAIFHHIKELFTSFVNEYNKSLDIQDITL